MKILQSVRDMIQRLPSVVKCSISPMMASQGKRNSVLDLMKGLLIVGMIFSHVQ